VPSDYKRAGLAPLASDLGGTADAQCPC